MTNRISNIEALLHQQQRFQSIPHLGMHPATNGYDMNPYQLYPGAQYPLNSIHPHGHPTVRPTHINPMSYQGYPIIPVDLAHMHQYSNLPRVNLPFRSEQLPQNPPQGHPLGVVPQVQVHVPTGQAQMHHNLQRANLEFRNRNSMHSSREYNSSASMRPNRSNVKHLSQQNTTSRSTQSVERTRSGGLMGQEAPLCVSNKDEIQTDLTSASKSGPAGGDSCSPAPTSIPSASDGAGVTLRLEDSVILIQDSCVPSGTSPVGPRTEKVRTPTHSDIANDGTDTSTQTRPDSSRKSF